MKTDKTFLSIQNSLRALVLLCCLPSFAADDSNEKLVVNIVKSNERYSTVSIKTDHAEEEINVPNNLELNSSTKLISNTGKVIVVKKSDQGVKIELDGRKVLLPKFKGKYGVKLSRTRPLYPKVEENIIVSGAQFSPQQIEMIRRAFADAGVNKTVNFSQHPIFSVIGDKNSSSTSISIDQEISREVRLFIHEQQISIQTSKEEQKSKEKN